MAFPFPFFLLIGMNVVMSAQGAIMAVDPTTGLRYATLTGQAYSQQTIWVKEDWEKLYVWNFTYQASAAEVLNALQGQYGVVIEAEKTKKTRFVSILPSLEDGLRGVRPRLVSSAHTTSKITVTGVKARNATDTIVAYFHREFLSVVDRGALTHLTLRESQELDEEDEANRIYVPDRRGDEDY